MLNISRYYLDNNIFWALAKDHGGKKLDHFNRSLIELNIIDSPRSVELLASPFSLLESIGSPHRKIETPQIELPKELLEEGDPENIKEYLLKSSIAYFSKTPSLSLNSLQNAVEVQSNFGTEFGRDLFKRVISNYTRSSSFEEYIHQALAFDYIQKYPYPKELIKKMVTSFAVGAFRAPEQGYNICWSRIIGHLWNSIEPSDLERYQISKEDNLKVKREDYLYKFNSDLMDTELTHIAAVGWCADENLHPVICFTSDPPEKVKFRIAIYKALLDSVEERISKINEEISFKPIPFQPGLVAICEHRSCRILEVFDVSQIKPEDRII